MQDVHLSVKLSHELIKAADQLAATTAIYSPEAADRINQLLNNNLRELRYVISMEPAEHGLLVNGLPFPAVNGPTPPSWQHCRGHVRTWRFVLAIIASAIGKPFGWLGQQQGRIVTDIVPTRGQETSQVGASSSSELLLHTEDAFHPRRATHFALFGLRNPHAVGTTIAPIAQAWPLLDQDTQNVLLSDGAIILPDDSYHKSKGESAHASGTPLSMHAIWKKPKGWGLRFDPGLYRQKHSIWYLVGSI